MTVAPETRGPQSTYRDEYAEEARKLCRLIAILQTSLM